MTFPLSSITPRLIRMQDPLKQGLKLRCFDCMAYTQNHSNARSIKTRIET